MSHWQPVPGIDGAWTGTYGFRGNTITMLVLDLGERRLAVFSPGTDVPEAAHTELEALGSVVALVSPGAFHHLGMPAWHARHPAAKLIATASGVGHIAKQHKGALAFEGLDALRAMAGDDLVLRETPGKHGDLLLLCKRGGKTLLFNNELLVNMRELPPNPLFKLLFRLFKAGPGLAFNGLAAKLLGANKKACAKFFADAIAEHGLDVFVPCHGEVLAGPDTRARVEALLA